MESRKPQSSKHPLGDVSATKWSLTTPMVNIVTGQSVGTLAEVLSRGQLVADRWLAQKEAGYGADAAEGETHKTHPDGIGVGAGAVATTQTVELLLGFDPAEPVQAAIGKPIGTEVSVPDLQHLTV